MQNSSLENIMLQGMNDAAKEEQGGLPMVGPIPNGSWFPMPWTAFWTWCRKQTARMMNWNTVTFLKVHEAGVDGDALERCTQRVQAQWARWEGMARYEGRPPTLRAHAQDNPTTTAIIAAIPPLSCTYRPDRPKWP